ncbi:MAG: CRISPR-associated endonuclease Cas2 [Halanaerobiales bacterium]|nr:CRISPR-associated endonuclease Cas2 [Halanaerobiales bacterium]
MKRYVICYDITDDKRRRRIYELLKDHGQRMQYSIFECMIDEKTFVMLKFKLRRLMDCAADSIIIYSICANCEEKIISMGFYYGGKKKGGEFIL